jgi:alkylation response protein AidB-like acyl-CoA dehydrogenase
MTSAYRAPLEEYRFLFEEVLGFSGLASVPGFAEATPDVVESILCEGAALAEEVVQPLNAPADRTGCRIEDGHVHTPPGFKEAFDVYRRGGWLGLTLDPAHGGQGLPRAVAAAFNEMITSASMAFGMFGGLTRGVAEALQAHGSADHKRLVLPRLVSGQWTGAFDLTEPQAGTDLGLVATRAVPAGDGGYRLRGTKIFISAGDHDLAENIIHLVLARLPDAPPGTRGLSLFLVPKRVITGDGLPAGANGVEVGSLEEKMGNHGNPTCLIRFNDARGTLVGRPNRGLEVMFTALNSTRLGSGMQGVALAEAAYQRAARYARDRLQGRAPTGAKSPGQAADAIIHHADIRRMLMDMRAFVEGGRALALWVAIQVDCAAKHPDATCRQSADGIASLLTPVIKAHFTEMGFECTVQAQQVFGGHGYIREVGVEQLVRDARLAMLYEGANGVQASELMLRKLQSGGGHAIAHFLALVEECAESNCSRPEIGDFVTDLKGAVQHLRDAVGHVLHLLEDRREDAAAISAPFLRLVALVAMAWTWMRLGDISARRLEELPERDERRMFYENKLVVGRYFMRQRLPEAHACHARIVAASRPNFMLDASRF